MEDKRREQWKIAQVVLLIIVLWKDRRRAEGELLNISKVPLRFT